MNGSQRQRFLTIIPAISDDFEDVCQIQSIQPSASGFYTAKLDGSIGSNFITHGYSRSVIIKSFGDDLSGGEFIVEGFQNGAPVITDPFAGPVASDSVDTGLVFDTITSIKVTDNLLGSEFGATGGEVAYTKPLFLNWSNPNTNLMSYGLSVRNIAEREHSVLAWQVFTEGVPFETQVLDLAASGIFVLSSTSDADYIYRGLEGPSSGGTSVAYPLWDAFAVGVRFVESDDPRPTVIAFPQIGR